MGVVNVVVSLTIITLVVIWLMVGGYKSLVVGMCLLVVVVGCCCRCCDVLFNVVDMCAVDNGNYSDTTIQKLAFGKQNKSYSELPQTHQNVMTSYLNHQLCFI